MVSPNRKKHQTIKGVLMVVIVFMAIFPFIFFSTTEVEISEGVVSNVPKKPAKPEVEKPKHNVELPKFSKISDVKQRKQQFFNFLAPSVDKENERLQQLRNSLIAKQELLLKGDKLASEQIAVIENLAKLYKVKSSLSFSKKLDTLLKRVDVIPRELVLVQAANESAWGTSRFARIGLNFFGMWCYRKGCGLIPGSRDAGLKHEVAAYQSLDEMVSKYIHNLNTNAAYGLLRIIRADLRKNNQPLRANVLATGLLPYSERGFDYVIELNTMLRHNHNYIKS